MCVSGLHCGHADRRLQPPDGAWSYSDKHREDENRRLARERRERLLAEMRGAGLDALVIYGTSWQEAYLRYVSDFGILEGDGIAILTADGRCRLFVESLAEAERAAGEASGVESKFVRKLAHAVGGA